MNKAITISIALLLIALSGGAYFFNTKLPKLTKEKTLSALSAMGFDEAVLNESDIRIRAARFKNIALDPENISNIKILEIRYSPLSLITGAQPRTIIIDGLNLTGELSKNDGLTISGWKNNKSQLDLKNEIFKSLNIQNSRLSLLTENHGGISINYGLQTSPNGKHIEFQLHATSKQKALSFIANAKGYINKEGAWQTDIEIEQGKFELPNIKTSRLNGWVNVLSAKNKPLKIISELRAGGANIYGLPWQNISTTLEGTLNEYQIFADMKSVGFDGLELSLNLKHKNDTTRTSGRLYAPQLKTITQYLGIHNLKPFNEKHSEQLKNAKDIDIEFLFQGPDIIFRIKDGSQDIDIKDKFKLWVDYN